MTKVCPNNRIGVLGGTYDPVHSAHVALAEAAIKEAGLRKLIVMPARVQPFKQGKKVADNHHREAMVKLAFKDNPMAEVCDYEMNNQGLSYTVKTLTYLKSQYPDDQIFFISGTDSFLQMENWYKGEDILHMYSVAVSARPGYREDELNGKIREYKEKYGTEIVKIQARMPAISSTLVRGRIAAGEPVSDLVPTAVERYIEENGLYK